MESTTILIYEDKKYEYDTSALYELAAYFLRWGSNIYKREDTGEINCNISVSNVKEFRELKRIIRTLNCKVRITFNHELRVEPPCIIIYILTPAIISFLENVKRRPSTLIDADDETRNKMLNFFLCLDWKEDKSPYYVFVGDEDVPLLVKAILEDFDYSVILSLNYDTEIDGKKYFFDAEMTYYKKK